MPRFTSLSCLFRLQRAPPEKQYDSSCHKHGSNYSDHRIESKSKDEDQNEKKYAGIAEYDRDHTKET